MTVSSRDEVTQKMDVLETMMRDLSIKIKATEDHLTEVEVSPVLQQATSPPARRRARPRDYFNGDLRSDLLTQGRVTEDLSSGTQPP